MALSPEAEGRVARALGAYIRSTPARELPGELKRLRSLRPQALAGRAGEVLAALDDEGLRGLVIQWLDEKPGLPKKEAEVLRLAVERVEGWEDEIDNRTAKSPKKGPDGGADDLRVRIERERDKAARAREEARKTKEESRLTLQSERQRADHLDRRLTSLRDELERARSDTKRAQAELSKEKDARERDVRRERRSAERARAERDELKDRLKAARKEVAELRRLVRDLEQRLKKALSAPTKEKQSGPEGGHPKKRRSLSPPHGLFEEAPETLVAWLERPDVHVLIDGYNVTKAEEGFGDLHLPDQRDRLVQEVARLARKYGLVPTIVFDGSDVPPGTRRKTRLPVNVEYSSPDEIADDHLVARLSDLPPDPVVVVTNDRELQERARAKGATIARSEQLLALVR
ncbi:MAG: NYN domain-containing protein [Actinomycetota bacterium]|nr:NYN domain-containing protein [Actinomycetota bacterium]